MIISHANFICRSSQTVHQQMKRKVVETNSFTWTVEMRFRWLANNNYTFDIKIALVILSVDYKHL